MNPNHIANIEDEQARKSCFPAWILSERHKQLQQNKNHNICMHYMVQPAVKKKMFISLTLVKLPEIFERLTLTLERTTRTIWVKSIHDLQHK